MDITGRPPGPGAVQASQRRFSNSHHPEFAMSPIPGELGTTAVVIDSMPLFAAGLARLLVRDCGIQVIGRTGDLNVGLALIERTQPSVAVLDRALMGPDMGEVLATVSRCSPHTRAVLMLACDSDSDSIRGLLAGAYRCILKSTSPYAMCSIFWRLLNEQTAIVPLNSTDCS